MIDRKSLKYIIEQLRAKQKYPQAKEILDIFAEQATTMEDYDTLGECAMIAQHHELRLKCAHFVYSSATTSKQLFDARENLYQCYNTLNYPEKALFYIDLNLQVKPNDTDTLLHKAFNLSLLGEKQKASELIYALRDSTTDTKIKETIESSMSMELLRKGETAKGIISFMNAGKKKNPLFEERLKLKFWDGIAQPGKTIVINGEGGIGDEFINIRFIKNLKDLGMNPIFFSSWSMFRPDTVKLFRRHGIEVTTTYNEFKPDYLWTHLMSLPGYLGLSENQLWREPYIFPLKQEKNKLSDKKFKIGIKCNGNPYFEQDIYRSIPIEDMLSIVPENCSVYYFDLDKEYPGTISLKDKIKDWDDTLDYIDQMDIIISSCTSLVHAAGAMGKKTIVLVPIAKYYTWESTRTDNSTPWYGDNFTVIEQSKPRCWKTPLEKAKQILLDYINS